MKEHSAGDPLDRAWTALAVGALLACAALGLLSVALSLPSDDDFNMAAIGREQGWFPYAFQSTYMHWSGRWSGHGLLAALLSAMDLERHYGLALIGVAAVQCLALAALLRVLTGGLLARWRGAVAALALWGWLWACRPAPHDTIYWLSGAVAYELPAAATAWIVASACGMTSRSATGALSRAALLGLACILVAGLHEYYGALLCGLSGLGTVWLQRAGSARWRAWGLLFLLACAGFLVVQLAPGNSAREASHLGGARRLAAVLRHLRLDVLALAPRFLLDAKLLLLTLGFVLHPAVGRLRPAWLEGALPRWRWRILGTWSFVLAAGMAAIHWSTGWTLFGRFLDSQYVLFFLGWFTVVFVWTRWRVDDAWFRSTPARALRWAALLMALFALATTGNPRTMLPDLVGGRVTRWRAHQLERYETLRRARDEGRGGLRVARSPAAPRLYRAEGLSSDRSSPVNQAWAAYFDLDWIELEPAGDFEPPDRNGAEPPGRNGAEPPDRNGAEPPGRNGAEPPG